MVGERRLVAPAVRQHAVALVGEALVVELLEAPDDRLHEGRVEGLVVVLEVDPAGHPGDVLLPLLRVLEHRLARGLVEGGDAHLLDLALVGDAQLALCLELCREPVGVPSEAPVHLLAAHGLEAREEVLRVAREQMTVVRKAVGEGGSIVEDPLGCAFALLDGGPEGVVLLPEGEDALLELREAWARAERLGRFAVCGKRVGHLVIPRAGRRALSTRGRRVPRYHLACDSCEPPLIAGDDGPTRSVLLVAIPAAETAVGAGVATKVRNGLRLELQRATFFRRLPGDGRIGTSACDSTRSASLSVFARATVPHAGVLPSRGRNFTRARLKHPHNGSGSRGMRVVPGSQRLRATARPPIRTSARLRIRASAITAAASMRAAHRARAGRRAVAVCRAHSAPTVRSPAPSDVAGSRAPSRRSRPPRESGR